MKRFILLSVLVIFVFTNVTGQWYEKYGVDSLNKLPKSELEGHLLDMQALQGVSIFLSVSSALMLVGGALLYNASMDGINENSGQETFMGYLSYFGVILGMSMLVGGIILTPILIAGIIVRSGRISQIKEALGSTDLKVGVLNCPVNLHPGARGNPPAFGLTLAFHF